MRLVIQETAAEVGDLVAAYVIKRIADFKPTATRPFVLGLPTGSSLQSSSSKFWVRLSRARA